MWRLTSFHCLFFGPFSASGKTHSRRSCRSEPVYCTGRGEGGGGGVHVILFKILHSCNYTFKFSFSRFLYLNMQDYIFIHVSIILIFTSSITEHVAAVTQFQDHSSFIMCQPLSGDGVFVRVGV